MPLQRAIGHCIFCSGPGETRDHVVPQALGGQHVLGNSSCEPCRERLNRLVDGPILGRFLGPARAHYTPRTNKRQPQPVRMQSIPPEGGKMREELMRPLDTPDGIILCGFDPPGILTGRETIPGTAVIKGFNAYISPTYMQRLAAQPHSGTAVAVDDILLFMRMIAKIAHAAAYAYLGSDGFLPLLLDVIEGRDKDIFRYLGGGLGQTTPTSDGSQYRLGMRYEGKYVVISVQLFAQLGLAPYEAVAGIRRGGVIFA